ncbi:MAG: right-handed parallel beta-helix repeat-containing protein, partial [Planctomycetota bacterium]
MAAKTNLKTTLEILLFVLVVGAPVAAGGQIIYVDADADGAINGSSWFDAYNYLQDALTAANDGDEIRVAQGIYKPDQGAGITPGNSEATLQLKNGVTLKGGYAGFGEPDPNVRDIGMYETILSGDLNGDDIEITNPQDLEHEPSRAENSYHVVTGSGIDTTAVLDGFTITAGNANGSEDNEGGGMCNSSSSPTVNNCVFSTNSATHGGGMYNWDNSNPTLTNCTFSKNSADRAGGMLNRRFSNPTLTNCTFSDNSATTLNGGGMDNLWVCRPMLTNCTFRGNSAAQYGGGLDNYLSRPTLTNCTFTDNSAEDGGGMYNRSESNPTLTNCTFTGNSAEADGGGMFNAESNPTLTNCTFTDNSAEDGGGMYNDESSPTLIDCTFIENSAEGGGGMKNGYLCSPTLANCTFSGNLAGRGGGGMDNSFNSTVLNNCVFTGNLAEYGGGMSNFNNNLVLTNCTFAGNSLGTITISHYSTLEITSCIFWGNTGGAISAIDDVTVTVTYSDVQSGWPGEGNIDADPLFRDPDGIDDIPGTEDDNLRLLPDSPCIDAGDPNYVPGPN